MANGANSLMYQLPDLTNDLSYSSSEEDSYDLYLNMQRIPNNVPMPTFRKPLQSRKLFERKSSNVSKPSALMKFYENFGGANQMIASTPKNPPSATTDSLENSPMQLSPIIVIAKNNDANYPVSTTCARDDLSVPSTNKLLIHNKLNRRSKSYENLSKKKQTKHVSASVRAVTDHLQNLSETLRKERIEQSKFEGRKDQRKKNYSNVKNAASVSNEPKKQVTEEELRNSLKKSRNKELHKNENDLAGIEVLNFSSEDDVVVDKAISAVELCRRSCLPTRRTVLMERQTQTTDSLENVLKRASAVPISPLKEAEDVEREGHSVKRKIVEPEGTTSRKKKKSKTVLNLPAEVGKHNNSKNQSIKPVEAQSSNSSLENEEGKQKLRVSQRSMQNKLPTVDADVPGTSTSKYNKNFDRKMASAHIVSISSASENTTQKSLSNIESFEDRAISKNNLEDIADADPNTRDETNATHEHPRNSGIVDAASASTDLQNKGLENSKCNASHEKKRTRKIDSAVNTTIPNKASEIQGRQKICTSSMTLKNKISEKSKQNSNLESGRDSSKISAESTTFRSKSNDNQEYTEDSETADQVDGRRRKRGRPKGSKSRQTKLFLGAYNTTKRGRPKKTGVIQQSVNITKSHNKPRGRPKGSKNKIVALQTYFADRLSGFVRVPDNPFENNIEDDSRGENQPKRERKSTKRYVQSHFIGMNVMRKSLMPKSKKSAKQKSNVQVQHSNDQNPSTVNSTAPSVAEQSDFDRRESMMEPKVTCIKDKSINTSQNKSVTKNKRNRKNVSHTTVNNIDLEGIHSSIVSSTSKDSSVSEVSTRNKRNTNANTQSVKNSHDPKNSNSVEISSTSRDISVYQVSTRNRRNTSINAQPMKNAHDPKSSSSVVSSSTSKDVFEVSARSKRNTKANIQPKRNGHDSNSSNSATISSAAKQVPPRDTSKSKKKKQKNNIQTTENNNVDIENIELDMVCPLPEAVSDPKTSNKKNNKNRNTSIKSRENNNDLENINSEIDTGVVCSLVKDISVPTTSVSPSIVHDTISTQTNDDSISATVSGQQIVKTSGSTSTCLYTIVNKEVIALNWISRPEDMDVEPPVREDMDVEPPTYRVEKGEAVVQVNAKKHIVNVGRMFHIPTGAEYTIINLRDEPLVLFFHRMSPSL